MRGFMLLILLLVVQTPIASHAAAIHDAAAKGDVAAVMAALDAGVGVDESDGLRTPLYLAVKGEHIEVARLLLDRGADVNASISILGPALIPALAKRRVDLVILLLDRGANPNSQHGGKTVLHVAVTSQCFDCVRVLVEAGADVNAKTEDGKTPLHLARFRGQRETGDYLVSHGVIIPTPAPISMKLANADVENGRTHFTRVCSGCHNAEPAGANKTGPNLWGVVGRDKASVEKVRYSDALQSLEGVWTFEDLNKFLLEPMVTTPGVKMETVGVPDETERIDVIAYLRTLSDKPIPLP